MNEIIKKDELINIKGGDKYYTTVAGIRFLREEFKEPTKGIIISFEHELNELKKKYYKYRVLNRPKITDDEMNKLKLSEIGKCFKEIIWPKSYCSSFSKCGSNISNEEKFKKLTAKNLKQKDYAGYTLLQLACAVGDQASVDGIIKRAIVLSEEQKANKIPKEQILDIRSMLQGKGEIFDRQPLTLAVKSSNYDLVRSLTNEHELRPMDKRDKSKLHKYALKSELNGLEGNYFKYVTKGLIFGLIIGINMINIFTHRPHDQGSKTGGKAIAASVIFGIIFGTCYFGWKYNIRDTGNYEKEINKKFFGEENFTIINPEV